MGVSRKNLACPAVHCILQSCTLLTVAPRDDAHDSADLMIAPPLWLQLCRGLGATSGGQFSSVTLRQTLPSLADGTISTATTGPNTGSDATEAERGWERDWQDEGQTVFSQHAVLDPPAGAGPVKPGRLDGTLSSATSSGL